MLAGRLPLVLFLSLLVWSISSSARDSAKPEAVEAFRRFLVESLPGNSSWHFQSNTAAQRKELQRHLKKAVRLRFFAPWKRITLTRWSPAAGYPGRVTEDHRILYHPDKNEFALGSLEWIRKIRSANPISVDQLGQQDLQAYLREIVSVIPYLDAFGFSIKEIVMEAPLRVKLRYDSRANRLPARKQQLSEDVVEFYPDGSIKKSQLLERKGGLLH